MKNFPALATAWAIAAPFIASSFTQTAYDIAGTAGFGWLSLGVAAVALSLLISLLAWAGYVAATDGLDRALRLVP